MDATQAHSRMIRYHYLQINSTWVCRLLRACNDENTFVQYWLLVQASLSVSHKLPYSDLVSGSLVCEHGDSSLVLSL